MVRTGVLNALREGTAMPVPLLNAKPVQLANTATTIPTKKIASTVEAPRPPTSTTQLASMQFVVSS
jgi:hypothetical protein